jgi:tRNA1Val (adenine37-N6)-methyltransferase
MKLYLYQESDGYCYNSDSIFLYSFIKKFPIKGNILDVGCGVGVLSLLLAKSIEANYYAVEKQESMHFYASKNALLNKRELCISNCEFQEYRAEVAFDYIVSNPPFYSVDKNQSPNISKNIARYAHHLPVEVLISKSSALLKARGYFIFCYDAWQIESIFALLKENKLQAESVQFIHPKADKEAKTVMIAARKNSNARSKVLAPLITFNKDGSYTQEAQKAFKEANTHSIKAVRHG